MAALTEELLQLVRLLKARMLSLGTEGCGKTGLRSIRRQNNVAHSDTQRKRGIGKRHCVNC